LRGRPYQSVFGEHQLMRCVYGTGEKRKVEQVPLDNRLQLPQGKFSWLLQKRNQTALLEMPFQQVRGTEIFLKPVCGC